MKWAWSPNDPPAATPIANLASTSSRLAVVDRPGKTGIPYATEYNSHIDLVNHPPRLNIESCDAGNVLREKYEHEGN